MERGNELCPRNTEAFLLACSEKFVYVEGENKGRKVSWDYF